MSRSMHVGVTWCLAVFLATACTSNEPTSPVMSSAKGGKPGGGGGGASPPVGVSLGADVTSRAFAVNAGYAAGVDYPDTPGSAAAVWDAAGVPIHLPVDAAATYSSAFGINGANTVVGYAGESAVVWQASGPGTWALAAPLPAPDGAWQSTRAYAINAEGRIAGTGIRSDGLSFALRWTPGAAGYTVEVIPAAGAEYEFVGHAIANGTGWVAGWVRRVVNGAVAKDAFVWTSSGAVLIPSRLNGAATEARGINASGRVVGWSATAPRGGDSSPVTWTCTGSSCTGPSTLPTAARNVNYAFSIDDAGDIVGTSGLSGMLWDRCGTATVLSPPAGWHQSYGWAISGDGTAAVGYSYLDSSTLRATRWTLPVPGC